MRAALLLAFACTAVQATESPKAGVSRCEFGAFVTETDPAGLNVRQEPGTNGKVLGRLPPVYANASLNGYRVKVQVEVLGSRDGWIWVDKAQDNEALTEKPARRMHHGKGWVSGRKLGVKSQASRGYASPDARSPVVLSLADDESFDGDEWVDAGQLVGCSGKWALVEFNRSKLAAATQAALKLEPSAQAGLPPGRFRAWLNQICGVQETTCDGLGAEESQPAAPR